MAKSDLKVTKSDHAVKSQAVIVITEFADGHLSIRSDNKGRGTAAKFADAMVNLSYGIFKNKGWKDAPEDPAALSPAPLPAPSQGEPKEGGQG
jgi:hypothetical protein